MYKCLMVLLFSFPCVVIADSGVVTGKVQYLRTHNESFYESNWAPPIFWFTVEGGSSAGDCQKYGGNVLFVMDSDQAYSMVMAAFMSNKLIAVKFDDSEEKFQGYCMGKYVTLGNPPPSS